MRQVVCSTIDDLVEVVHYLFTNCNEYRCLLRPILRRFPLLYTLIDRCLCVHYFLPFGAAAMVIPETVIALVAQIFKETIQIVRNIGLVVDMAIRVAVGLAAYHIEGG